MSTFDDAFRELLEMEGGYVDDASDRGGETRYGISKRAYPEVDIIHLTLDLAKAIYHRDYWRPLRLDEILAPMVAREIFEQAVNFGLSGAVRNAQRALNYLGVEGVKVDGIMGPATIAALNRYPYQPVLAKALNGVQFARYLQIVEADPTQKRFARGWLRRVKL